MHVADEVNSPVVRCAGLLAAYQNYQLQAPTLVNIISWISSPS